MNGYRIYFLDAARRIRSAHWFEADDDEGAMWVAEHVSDACSDVFPGFELWHRGRRVGGSAGPVRVTQTWDAVNGRRQEALASFEEILRDSELRIAESKPLLSSIAEAKTKRQSDEGS